jgi:hypothetical protein
VLVGAQVVHPRSFGPRLLGGGLLVEKPHVAFMPCAWKLPVGRRSIVCRSKSASSFLRRVSPAPPSWSTLSEYDGGAAVDLEDGHADHQQP